MEDQTQERAPRNRTLSCTNDEISRLSSDILKVDMHVSLQDINCRVIGGDFFAVTKYLPEAFVDLLILDPPYNISKNYNGSSFKKKEEGLYRDWFQKMIGLLIPMLKQDSTIYVCSDWKTSTLIYPVLAQKFIVRNRITWEREKGRGARMNWKNNTEDIWFCTNSDDYYFNVEAVKLKRKVLAPYRTHGKPKDWKKEKRGNYRETHPSNIWTDLTVPFWSMSENTDHPTQKSEKLIAKLILASSKTDDLVFDPFLGSGTTAVVAEKLDRHWCGIDINTQYLCWGLKRIAIAKNDSKIQGYEDGTFWERNSMTVQSKQQSRIRKQNSLF